MRAFVAVELSEACRRALREAVDRLRAAVAGVRWVRAESLHLTMKFIGELAEADLPRAIECLAGAAAGVEPFAMRVAGLSGFPPSGVPRVIHAGVDEPSGALKALQRGVEEALAAELGLPKEARPYTAHITLGRVKDRRKCAAMAEIAAAVADQDFGRVRVGSFVLMRSELRPDGAVYAVVHRFGLGSDAA